MIIWMVKDTQSNEYFRIIIIDNELLFKKYYLENSIWLTWKGINIMKEIDFCNVDEDILIVEMDVT